MAGQYNGEPDQRALAMVTATPALRGEYLKTCEATEQVLAQAIAACTGTDPRADLSPKILAAAMATAARVAAEHWQETGAPTPFTDVLREALTCLTPSLSREEQAR